MTDLPPAVHKFGGTSLGNGARIRAAARLVRAGGGAPVVVVSALSGVTSELEWLAGAAEGSERRAAIDALRHRHREAAATLFGVAGTTDDQAVLLDAEGAAADLAALHARIDDILDGVEGAGPGTPASAAAPAGRREPGRRHDALVAAGEDLSAALMAAALRLEGTDALALDARDVVRTDSRFGQAVPEDETTVQLARRQLTPLLSRGTVPVLQGFIGADANGLTTTLGRGGSDFTAAIIGAALGAREVTIWTDVDGIFSADPAGVPGARILPELGYEEAVELAYFGAKVIHPAAAKHAVGRGVALRVRNTFRPEARGTLIRTDRRRTPGVAALAHKPGTTLIRVRSRPLFMAYGFLARVFDVLTRHGVPVDLVATSHTSTAFTVDRTAEIDEVRRSLEEVAEVEVLDDLATVSVIGRGLLDVPGITAEIFRVLGDSPIHLISQATDTSLSILVARDEARPLVRRLHEGLMETDTPPEERS